jgi:virulence-associated protein VagC
MSSDVETESIGHFDDGASQAIHIPNGFPFEGTSHTSLFVSGIY